MCVLHHDVKCFSLWVGSLKNTNGFLVSTVTICERCKQEVIQMCQVHFSALSVMSWLVCVVGSGDN